MTASTAVSPSAATQVRSRAKALRALGRREARRIVTSPALLALAGVAVLTGGLEGLSGGKNGGPPDRAAFYGVLLYFCALYLGVVFYVAAHLVTSSARRTHAEHQLAANPLAERERGAGLCLGAIIGPGVVALVAVVALALLGNDVVLSDGEQPLALIHLAQIGMTLIGGALFGVLWATWLRFPGSLPLGLICLMLGTAWFLNDARTPVDTWPWFAPYITTPDFWDASWTSSGSHGWHLGYLVALCALAVCGVLVRQREGRGRWIAVSAGVVVATSVIGWVQLT